MFALIVVVGVIFVCIATTKGILVEQIYPDQEWEQKCIPQLKEYYFKHILPELVYPMHKPSYFL